MDKNSIKYLIHSFPKEITKIYNEHREAFLNFGKKYGIDDADLADIYQEAFIALRNHALNGKLDTVKSSLKTYLFGIGKFMIFDLLKEKKKTSSLDSSYQSIDNQIDLIDSGIEKEELTLEQQSLRKHFQNLGKKCQEVLTLFYSRGLTIDEIVEFSNYTSNSVVRSQKSRCLKTLKKMIKS